MSAPGPRLSRLSLDEMTSAGRPQVATAFRKGRDDGQLSPSETEESEHDGNGPAVVRSPAQLMYSLERLSDKSKALVREVFNESPQIALQRCRRIDNTYAFQMTELITTSVRIRAPGNGSPRLSCTCGPDDDAVGVPCRHLIWLMDQILKQTLYDHDGGKPLTMMTDGYAEEMGEPFWKIAEHHLDVLAAGLHCPVSDPDAYSNGEDDADDANEDDHGDEHDEDQDGDEGGSVLDHHRVLESRELLSAVYDMDPHDFRPDIFDRPASGKEVIKRGDLDYTVFRMLLDNHHFFHYFLSLCRAADPINDPFRKLAQRVDRVLADLDAHACASRPATPAAESPVDVAWAARHLVGVVGLIRSAIYSRDRPLQPPQALSAARTLVHVLSAVVARSRDAHAGPTRRSRNLYLRLVGDRDDGFVLAELALLPEAASHFVHSLEAIHDRIGVLGAPISYVERLRGLLARLRKSTACLKRPIEGQEELRGPKRMK